MRAEYKKSHTTGLVVSIFGAAPSGGAANDFTPATFPISRVILTDFALVSDVDDAPCQIGTVSIASGVFAAQFELEATRVKAGGVVTMPNDGLTMDVTSDIVPAVKQTGAVTAVLAGYFNFHVPGPSASEAATMVSNSFAQYILDENGFFVLDENGANIQQE